MNIFKTIGNFFSKSADSSTDKFISLRSSDDILFKLLGTDYKFGTQSKDFLLKAYGMNPYVFMVVDRITQRFVQIDKRLLDSRNLEIEDRDFLDLLKSPNNKEDESSFLYRAAATYLAAGECFIIRDQELGERDQYYVPINYNVTINEDTKGNVISYWVTRFGESQTYLPHEVLHKFTPDITIDTNHGFGTLRANRKVWESNNEVWASEAALHKNKGISGVLYSDGNRPMTDKEQKQLQDKYDKDNTGATNFGKVRISTGKLGYIQMGMNPNDLKSIETRIEHLRTICASFNVDSKIFNDPGATTYNNMAEANRAMIINAVIPLSKTLLPSIVSFMSKSLFKDYSMELIEEDIHELQITMEQKSARIGREVVQGIISPLHARQILYPELLETEDGAVLSQVDTRETVSIDEILRLQQSINDDQITRDNAIAMLSAIYGFDEATANEILG